MEFIKTNDLLPKPGKLSENSANKNNKYYHVTLHGFGSCFAMYLEDGNGNLDWYSSYHSKIIVPVLEWLKPE